MSKFLRLASGLVALLIAASAARGGPRQAPAHFLSGRRDRLRPRSRIRPVFEHRSTRPFSSGLLTYDYLARPAKLVPMTAESMPEVSEGGRTYIVASEARHLFRTRSGVQGPAARADAEDYVYSFKRFADPANRRRGRSCSKGKIDGLDEQTEAAKKSGKFDYDATIPGHGRARQVHAALQAHRRRLPVSVHARPRSVRRSRARSRRGVRRTTCRRIRSAPARTC